MYRCFSLRRKPFRQKLSTTLASVGAVSLSVVIAGCGGAPRSTNTIDRGQQLIEKDENAPLTIEQLKQLTRAYADRYFVLIAGVCREINEKSTDPQAIMAADLLKISGTSAIYDAVTGGDPYSQKLDIICGVTLQSQYWIDQGHAWEVFGPELGDKLAATLRQVRIEAWQLAERALSSTNMEMLDRLIWEYLKSMSSVNIRFLYGLAILQKVAGKNHWKN